jgi:hypothetical protein
MLALGPRPSRIVALFAAAWLALGCGPLYVRTRTLAADRAQLLTAAAASARAIGMTEISVDSATGRVVASTRDTTLESEPGGTFCSTSWVSCVGGSRVWNTVVYQRWMIDVSLTPRRDGRYGVRAELNGTEIGADDETKDCVLRSYLTILDATVAGRPLPRRYCGLHGAGLPKRVARTGR